MTDYSVGRIGEGEVSAWELGTGSLLNSPLLGSMNLIALSTGLVLEPRRMWVAFGRGCQSRNLYGADARQAVEDSQWQNIAEVKAEFLEVAGSKLPGRARTLEFFAYSAVSMLIHAAIAIPALVLRIGTDVILKKNIIEAVKPHKRTDLY